MSCKPTERSCFYKQMSKSMRLEKKKKPMLMCCRCQFTSGAILIKEQSYFPQFCLMYFIIASFDERFQIKLDFWSTSWQRQTVGEVRRVVFRYLSRVIFGANQSIWHQIDGFIKLIVSSSPPVIDLSVVVFSWRKRKTKRPFGFLSTCLDDRQ